MYKYLEQTLSASRFFSLLKNCSLSCANTWVGFTLPMVSPLRNPNSPMIQSPKLSLSANFKTCEPLASALPPPRHRPSWPILSGSLCNSISVQVMMALISMEGLGQCLAHWRWGQSWDSDHLTFGIKYVARHETVWSGDHRNIVFPGSCQEICLGD